MCFVDAAAAATAAASYCATVWAGIQEVTSLWLDKIFVDVAAAATATAAASYCATVWAGIQEVTSLWLD